MKDNSRCYGLAQHSVGGVIDSHYNEYQVLCLDRMVEQDLREHYGDLVFPTKISEM